MEMQIVEAKADPGSDACTSFSKPCSDCSSEIEYLCKSLRGERGAKLSSKTGSERSDKALVSETSAELFAVAKSSFTFKAWWGVSQ